MADEYEDVAGIYEPKPDATSIDLVERLKREEEELARQPLNLPVSSGRMYMGPKLTPGAEEAFLNMPTVPGRGVSVNLMPPPTEPAVRPGLPTEAEELARIQAGDVPGFTKTIGFRRDVPMTIPEDPAAARFALVSEYQRMRAAGVPAAEAESRVGINLMGAAGRYGTGRRYNVSGVGLVDEYGNVVARAPERTPRPINVGGVGLVDPQTGRVIVGPPEKPIVETEVIPATEGTEAIPAQPATKGFFGIGAKPAVPAVPATPARGERRIVRTIQPGSKGKLGKEEASAFLKQAGGDKAEARRLAVQAGYAL